MNVDDDDAALVEQTARQFIRTFGSAAVEHLRAQASKAKVQHDQLSADAWEDIASAAERLLAASPVELPATPGSRAR
jgi:hypothetical protein